MWDLVSVNGSYECNMTLKDFRIIRPLVKKSKTRLRITKKEGLPFFLYRNRKRKVTYISVILFFLFLHTMSLFIWDIEFEGNQKYTDGVLMDFLYSYGYKHGMKISNITCEDIEKQIRNEYNDINWVSAMIDGTKLIVKVKENTGILHLEENTESGSGDLVADKEGVVREIVTRQGTPVVHVGDQVAKGDILVSGVVDIIDDSSTVVNRHYVRADADVTLELSYYYKDTIKKAYKKRVYEEEKKQYFIQGFGYRFVFLPMNLKDVKAEVYTDTKQVHIFSNFYLPFYYGDSIIKYYSEVDSVYTDEQLKGIAEGRLSYYLKNLEKMGVEIIENNVKILVNNNNCVAEGNIVVQEKTGVNQEVPQEDKIEETTGAE